MSSRFVTIKKFEELTGYSEKATRAKITRGQWLMSDVFQKAPDGRILMDMQGFERWVLHGIPTADELIERRRNPS